MNRPRTVVWRGALPLWPLLLVALPLAVIFLFSLAIAGALVVGGALLASLLLPRLGGRRKPPDDGTIELDASQYRRLPDPRKQR
jgi:hypothetical protein